MKMFGYNKHYELLIKVYTLQAKLSFPAHIWLVPLPAAL